MTLADDKTRLRRLIMAKRLALTPEEAVRRSVLAQERLLASPLWKLARGVALYVAAKGEISTELLLRAAWAQGKSVFLPRVESRPGPDASDQTSGASSTEQMLGASSTEQMLGASSTEQMSGTPGTGQVSGAPRTDSMSGVLHAGQVSGVSRAGRMSFAPCMSLAELRPGAFNIPEPSAAPCAGDLSPNQLPDWPPALFVLPGLAFDRRGWRLGWGGGYYDSFLVDAKTTPGIQLVGLAYAFQLLETIPALEWDVPLHAICTDEELLLPNQKLGNKLVMKL